MRTTVIVGGGAAGAMLAIALAQRIEGAHHKVVLVERSDTWGRGAAYGRHAFPYLLNATVGAMSIAPDDPQHFLRFMQAREPGTQAGDFVTREAFGDYVEASLRQVTGRADAPVILRKGEVTDLQPLGAAGWDVRCADGASLHAHHTVLATGHPATALATAGGGGADTLWSDPMDPAHHDATARNVFILGSGLTMVDTVCALIARSSDRRIDVLSRRGLLPLDQSDLAPVAHGDPRLAAVLNGGGSLREVVRTAVDVGRTVAHAGGDWRDVVTRIRRSVPEIWPRLSPADRRRFLRHVRPYWDIHRHRCPARVVAQLESLKKRGILRIHAGRLDHLRRAGDGIEVGFRPRGSGGIETLRVDRVFNCTGPDYDLARVGGALWRSLLTRGLVAQDTLGLGIDTDGDARVLSADGSAVPNLYCFGPLRRARLWEATAISELREQAAELSRHLLSHEGTTP